MQHLQPFPNQPGTKSADENSVPQRLPGLDESAGGQLAHRCGNWFVSGCLAKLPRLRCVSGSQSSEEESSQGKMELRTSSLLRHIEFQLFLLAQLFALEHDLVRNWRASWLSALIQMPIPGFYFSVILCLCLTSSSSLPTCSRNIAPVLLRPLTVTNSVDSLESLYQTNWNLNKVDTWQRCG